MEFKKIQQFIGTNIKQKMWIKIREINKDTFSNQILLESIVYSNRDADSKRFKTRNYYLPKGIIKNYNSINGKNFYDQPII